jgi:hypothetical protein
MIDLFQILAEQEQLNAPQNRMADEWALGSGAGASSSDASAARLAREFCSVVD